MAFILYGLRKFMSFSVPPQDCGFSSPIGPQFLTKPATCASETLAGRFAIILMWRISLEIDRGGSRRSRPENSPFQVTDQPKRLRERPAYEPLEDVDVCESDQPGRLSVPADKTNHQKEP